MTHSTPARSHIPKLLAGLLLSATLGAALGLGAVLLIAALLLWSRYGTAVFFEMIAAGIAACF